MAFNSIRDVVFMAHMSRIHVTLESREGMMCGIHSYLQKLTKCEIVHLVSFDKICKNLRKKSCVLNCRSIPKRIHSKSVNFNLFIQLY